MPRRRPPLPPMPPAPPAALLALLLALAALLAGVPAGVPAAPVAAQDGAPRVDVVRVDGAITPPLARFVEKSLRAASADGAAAVVLELDTPGGLMTSMDEIVADILASEVPVVVYVAPDGARAASAGVFITYAAHVAAMAPATRIGSASPVTLGEGGAPATTDETMTAKITNDAVSQIRNLAELRGRNADWGERAVREAANVTADEAAQLGVVDLVAPDLPTLLREIDGRSVTLAGEPAAIRTAGAATRSVEMGWLDGLFQLLADPTIAYLLLSLGGLGLFLELSNPGTTLPGVIGGLGVLLGLFGLGTLPVNWAGVLLIAFAFLLFVVDLFVPSFGTLTVGGVIAFVLGSFLLIDGGAAPGLAIAPAVIWTMTALLVGFFVLVGAAVLRARWRTPTTGREGLIGAVGTVRRPLAPDGMVFVAGELWQATLVGGDGGRALPVGTPVAVSGIDGLRLLVRPATAPEAASAGVAAIDDAPPAETTPFPNPIPTPSAAGAGVPSVEKI